MTGTWTIPIDMIKWKEGEVHEVPSPDKELQTTKELRWERQPPLGKSPDTLVIHYQLVSPENMGIQLTLYELSRL